LLESLLLLSKDYQKVKKKEGRVRRAAEEREAEESKEKIP